MIGTNPCTIRYRMGKLRQYLAVPVNPSRVRYAAILLVVRRVEISAAALRYLDDRMVRRPGMGQVRLFWSTVFP